ncbi:MAG TPA: hypothetical protein VK904_07050 [Miltoncostaeaceae bacterium]|nr:hypothetical protein [Miltoncostaeaceae bacterium]
MAIDEFVPGQWTDAGAGQAIRLLGPDAGRVFAYGSPAGGSRRASR